MISPTALLYPAARYQGASADRVLMGDLSLIVSSTGALHPEAAVNIIQNLLQTVAQTRPI